MTLKITLVGCGAVAQGLYGKPLRKLERQGLLRVTGLVDPHASHAATMGSLFPRAAVYGDLATALATDESHLTIVLSPAHLHAEHAILALQNGNHVLCEKPMATTEEKCARMIAIAHETERVLAIGMIRRFFPAFQRLREWIVSQRFGEIQFFRYQEGRKFDWDVTTPAAFRRKTRAVQESSLISALTRLIS